MPTKMIRYEKIMNGSVEEQLEIANSFNENMKIIKDSRKKKNG